MCYPTWCLKNWRRRVRIGPLLAPTRISPPHDSLEDRLGDITPCYEFAPEPESFGNFVHFMDPADSGPLRNDKFDVRSWNGFRCDAAKHGPQISTSNTDQESISSGFHTCPSCVGESFALEVTRVLGPWSAERSGQFPLFIAKPLPNAMRTCC